MKIAAAGFVSAGAVAGMLMATPSAVSAATSAVPPSASVQAAADTCGQAMDASITWIWSLDLGITPYADPRAQVDLLRLMARAYTGWIGPRAMEYALYVENSCL